VQQKGEIDLHREGQILRIFTQARKVEVCEDTQSLRTTL